MYINARRLQLVLLIFLSLIGCIDIPAQTTAPKKKQPKKTATIEDAKIYKEAMVWFKRGEDLIGTPKENSDEQLGYFAKAIQIMPDFLEAHYNLGLIYAGRKQMKEAAAEFERVLKIEPKFDPSIYFLLASTYQELGENSSASTALEEGLRRKPGDLKMLRALAYLQFNDKNEDAALNTLQRVLELDPIDVSSRIELAQLFHKRNEIDPAISNYQEALRVEPENFTAHFNLGLIYFRQKKYPEAAAELESANRVKPGNADLLEKLADAYSFQQQHAKAAAIYKSALEKALDPATLYAKLGFSLANMNQGAEAVTALENAARLNSKNADTFFLLGDLYTELKRPDDAVAAYKRSLEINPKQKEVHYNLGTLYAEQKKLEDAIAELKLSVQLDPNYFPAWANLAIVAEKLELDKEAIQANEKLIALGKGQAQNYFRLGVLYAKSDQPDPSIAAFAKAVEMEPDKYRQILGEELKKVHSVLDPVRYKEPFRRLLDQPAR